MAKSAKQAIEQIAKHQKVYENLVSESFKVKNKILSAGKVLNNLIKSFPKKDKLLYAEKLAKFGTYETIKATYKQK